MGDALGRQPFRRQGAQRINGPILPPGLQPLSVNAAPPPPSTGDTIYGMSVTIYGVSFTIYGA